MANTIRILTQLAFFQQGPEALPSNKTTLFVCCIASVIFSTLNLTQLIDVPIEYIMLAEVINLLVLIGLVYLFLKILRGETYRLTQCALALVGINFLLNILFTCTYLLGLNLLLFFVVWHGCLYLFVMTKTLELSNLLGIVMSIIFFYLYLATHAAVADYILRLGGVTG